MDSGSGVTAWPAYDVERTSVRVVLLDDDERLLLFRTVDPTMPEIGEWWELPGGGIEPGESYAETAVREICEETGFEVSLAVLPDLPRWNRDSTYVRRHVRTWQHEVVVVARVAPARRRCRARTAVPRRSSTSTSATGGGRRTRSRTRAAPGSSRGACPSCSRGSSPARCSTSRSTSGTDAVVRSVA